MLDKELRVLAANRSFYLTFKVGQDETEYRLLYELGDRQWDIPGLRVLGLSSGTTLSWDRHEISLAEGERLTE